MGTIKIGEAEQSVISKIEEIKEKNKVRLDRTLRGIKIIRNQISDSDNKIIREIKTRADETMRRTEHLIHVIQGIEFSREYDENKFFVVWSEVNDKTGSYYKYGFGISMSREQVSEKQFIFALAAWEREVCKRLTLFKELEGSTYDFACPTLETDIRKLLYEYVIKN